MNNAIRLLQAVDTCMEDDGAGPMVRKARAAGLARLLVELLGTDVAEELEIQIGTACMDEKHS